MLHRDLALALIDRLCDEGINSQVRITTYPGEPGEDDGDTPGWEVTPTTRANGSGLDICLVGRIADELGIAVNYSAGSGFSLSQRVNQGAEAA
jgi:hypothetical protein